MTLLGFDLGSPSATNLISIILVIVTGVYVYLTWKIARSNELMIKQVQKQYEEEARPWIYANFECREEVIVSIKISNKGRSPAYNLVISLDKDFYAFADSATEKNVRLLPIFNNTIEWFPPGSEVFINLAQGFNFDIIEEDKNITPSRLTINFKYSGKFSNYDENCILDFSPYYGTVSPKTVLDQLIKITGYLKKIADK